MLLPEVITTFAGAPDVFTVPFELYCNVVQLAGINEPAKPFKVKQDDEVAPTTGPPNQNELIGVEPPLVVTVNVVLGVALQYVVVPVIPVAVTGTAKGTNIEAVTVQPPPSAAVTVYVVFAVILVAVTVRFGLVTIFADGVQLKAELGKVLIYV